MHKRKVNTRGGETMRRIELIKKKWEDENMVNRGLIKNGKKTMKRKERTEN